MKQLILASGAGTYGESFAFDTQALKTGAIVFLDGIKKVDTKASANPTTALDNSLISIAVGGEGNKLGVLGSFDVHGFRYTKTEKQDEVKTKYTIELPTSGLPVVNNQYIITIGFNGSNEIDPSNQKGIVVDGKELQPNTWTKLAEKLCLAINNKVGNKVVCTVDGTTKTKFYIESKVKDLDFTVVVAGGLDTTKVTRTTSFAPAINDASYMDTLWYQTMGSNGNFYSNDCSHMYNKPVFTGTYTTFNLSFQSPRIGRQGVDENVTQQIMIAVPTGATCIADLDDFFTKLMANQLTIKSV